MLPRLPRGARWGMIEAMRGHLRRPTGRDLYVVSQAGLLLSALSVAALTSRASYWHPLWVVAILGALAVAAHAFAIRIGHQRLSASFIALVLAMTLLGPAPARFH